MDEVLDGRPNKLALGIHIFFLFRHTAVFRKALSALVGIHDAMACISVSLALRNTKEITVPDGVSVSGDLVATWSQILQLGVLMGENIGDRHLYTSQIQAYTSSFTFHTPYVLVVV